MTEPMGERGCGRCRALDLVVAEKDQEIEKLKNRVSLLSVSANQIRDAYDDGYNARLRTLVVGLGRALADSLSGFKYVKLRNSVDCEYGNGLGYERCIFKIEKVFASIPEELRKEIEKV